MKPGVLGRIFGQEILGLNSNFSFRSHNKM